MRAKEVTDRAKRRAKIIAEAAHIAERKKQQNQEPQSSSK
jgi:hypothetical protein